MLNNLDRKLAGERYRQLQREARIERLFTSEDRRANFWQRLEERLGDLLIRMGSRLKQGVRYPVSSKPKEVTP